MIYLYFIAILTGIISATLLYVSKQLLLMYQKPFLDTLFSIIRFLLIVIFLYAILQFKTSIFILLLGLFIIGYIGTIVMLVNYSKSER